MADTKKNLYLSLLELTRLANDETREMESNREAVKAITLVIQEAELKKAIVPPYYQPLSNRLRVLLDIPIKEDYYGI